MKIPKINSSAGPTTFPSRNCGTWRLESSLLESRKRAPMCICEARAIAGTSRKRASCCCETRQPGNVWWERVENENQVLAHSPCCCRRCCCMVTQRPRPHTWNVSNGRQTGSGFDHNRLTPKLSWTSTLTCSLGKGSDSRLLRVQAVLMVNF